MRKKSTTNFIVFIIIVLMYFIPKYLEFTTYNYYEEVRTVIHVLKNISYVCAAAWYLLKVIYKGKYSFKYMIAICFATIYLSYQAFLEDVKAIFVVFLLSLIFDERYLYRYVRTIFSCSCILYIFTIISCRIGIIENTVANREKFGDIWTAGGNGFEYSGQMIMMLIPIVFMYYFLRRNKITLLDNLLWIGITFVVFLQCKTITGAVLILLFIFSFSFINCKGIRTRIIKSKFVKMLPVVSCSVIVLLELLYRRRLSFMVTIDQLLNGRLSVTDRIIDRYGIWLWGSSFENNTLDGKYEIIDSEYLYNALNAGVIYLIVSLVFCVLIVRYVQKKHDACLTLIWSMIFINAIINNGIWGIVMNPFSILLVPALKDYFVERKKLIICARKKE